MLESLDLHYFLRGLLPVGAVGVTGFAGFAGHFACVSRKEFITARASVRFIGRLISSGSPQGSQRPISPGCPGETWSPPEAHFTVHLLPKTYPHQISRTPMATESRDNASELTTAPAIPPPMIASPPRIVGIHHHFGAPRSGSRKSPQPTPARAFPVMGQSRIMRSADRPIPADVRGLGAYISPSSSLNGSPSVPARP